MAGSVFYPDECLLTGLPDLMISSSGSFAARAAHPLLYSSIIKTFWAQMLKLK
jgi:hypothetical protein